MRTITPFLWFNDQAEEAARFYTSVIKNSKILSTSRYSKAGPGPEGSVMTVEFELDGERFVALNGGPQYTFSQAVSFVINCETQQDVDHYWTHLSAGGKEIQCGWLNDKYGLSWQIVPTILPELLQHTNPEKTKRVMEAMFKMVKLDIEGLKRAAQG